MPRELSQQTIALVKATIPALEQKGLDITTRMYERLFTHASIRDLFNQSHHGGSGSQPKALAAAVLAYARHIENPGVLASAIERIAQKHVGLNILPEHYPFVGEALLGAIGDVLGDVASEEILKAWGEAYWFLAEVLMGREGELYHQHATAPGGWTGWRSFVLQKKQKESECITSFVLRPEDGGTILRHRPGQYLTFWFEMPGHAPLKRNYSISCAPNDATYRITVKRERGGKASSWLHDQLEAGALLKVAAPAGEFFLEETQQRPVVLVSGGVGLTPLVSMLETLADRSSPVLTHFVHGARDGSVHAMGSHIRELAARHPTMTTTTFYETPRAVDVAGRDFDQTGLISVDWLRANTPMAEADYFLCGPKPFLSALVHGLAAAGVPSSRIHYEFFGPADELLES